MGGELNKLAGRFKKALEKEEEAHRKAVEARNAWLVAAAYERKEFLVELAEFGKRIGVLDVRRKAGTLLFGFGSRSLEFREAVEGNRIALEHAAAQGHEAVILTEEGEWLLERAGRHEPFIPGGLEDLLVVALGLPRPGGGAAAPKRAAPPPAPSKAVDTGVEVEPATPAEEGAQAPGPARGPSHGSPAELGRSGTRGFKPAKELHPGAVVKDLKGPGPK